jgi:hypothetical protein
MSRLMDWLTPPASPPPRHFNESSAALLARLGSPKPGVTKQILAEAQAAYDEVADRAESAERRATTIQGAVAIAASLSLAGGSLLLDANKVSSHGWRIAFSAGFAIALGMLAMAAWRAFLVTWPRFMWASPAFSEIVGHAKLPCDGAAQLQLARDLLISYGRNDSIAALKIRLLGQAVRWLIAALVVVTILGVMLAAYSASRDRGQTSPASPVPTPTASASPKVTPP